MQAAGVTAMELHINRQNKNEKNIAQRRKKRMFSIKFEIAFHWSKGAFRSKWNNFISFSQFYDESLLYYLTASSPRTVDNNNMQ